MGKEWEAKRRQDGYYRMAKKEGYRARSAYKLKELNKRFGLIRPGDRVLDIGAAPGGWSQVAVERVGEEGLVVGVDLQRIAPLQGARFIQGDMTNDGVALKVLELMPRADCVISDISPELSGTYSMDQARSVYLSVCALALARRTLRRGGNFVTKVFEGEDLEELTTPVKEEFRLIKRFHPRSSRSKSSEVYVVGRGFRGG